MENIVIGLGFVSKKTLKYITKGSHYHKLCQIFEISYLSLTDKLLLPYVRHGISILWKHFESTLLLHTTDGVHLSTHVDGKDCRNNSSEHIVVAKNCISSLYS